MSEQELWRRQRRHMYALNEQDLIRYARYVLGNAKNDSALVDFGAVRTARVMLDEALAQEPIREAAE